MRALTVKGWGALAAVAILMAAVVASAITAAHRPLLPGATVADSSLSDELDRCRLLGVDAEKDVACQAAWRRMRDHFFGLDRQGARP